MRFHLFPAKEHTPQHQPASLRRRLLAGLLALIGTVTIATVHIVESETGDHRYRAMMFVGLAFSVAGFLLHFRGRKSAG